LAIKKPERKNKDFFSLYINVLLMTFKGANTKQEQQIPVTSNWNCYMGDFWNPS